MNRFRTIISLLLGLLILSPAGLEAKNYTPKSVPNVQVEDYRKFVSNPDGILSKEAVYQIDTTLLRLKEERIAQVAVVAVESIGFAEPREFATELFRHWGIGEKGRDNVCWCSSLSVRGRWRLRWATAWRAHSPTDSARGLSSA